MSVEYVNYYRKGRMSKGSSKEAEDFLYWIVCPKVKRVIDNQSLSSCFMSQRKFNILIIN